MYQFHDILSLSNKFGRLAAVGILVILKKFVNENIDLFMTNHLIATMKKCHNGLKGKIPNAIAAFLEM
jgi:hypothetical protein